MVRTVVFAVVVVFVVVVEVDVVVVVETDPGCPKSSTPSQAESEGFRSQGSVHRGSWGLFSQSGGHLGLEGSLEQGQRGSFPIYLSQLVGQLKWKGSWEQGHLGSCPVNSLQLGGQFLWRGYLEQGQRWSFPV